MNEAPHPTVSSETVPGQALSIRRLFTAAGTHPFESVEWERRDARIGHGDHLAFEQRDVEFPKSWSQNATNIVAQKYFRGQLGSPARERSVKEMISRVAGTITGWGRAGGYFAGEEDAAAFNHELTHILLHQMAAFNSPVWFNVGFEESPQCSACFILSVEDTMESILDWNTKEGMIFRGGSGSGINLSNIRGSMEPLAKGGTASGPVSFMRGADSWAGTIKSGGKTRRAAKMVVLDVDHPDIREFIWCKANEEDKAAALRDAGFDMSIDGDGFKSIQYQNANNSVRDHRRVHARGRGGRRVAPDRPHHRPADRRADPRPRADARDRRGRMALRRPRRPVRHDHQPLAHQPGSGRINASNPCSEYMHVDNSACNLASLNLMKFRRADGSLDVEGFEHTVDIMLLAQEIIVGPSSYPTEEIARERPRLPPARAGLRQPRRVPDEQRHALRLRRRPRRSRGDHRADDRPRLPALGRDRRRARARTTATRRTASRTTTVMRMHRDAAHAITDDSCPDSELLAAARRSWDEAVELGEKLGYRNAQATVLAPTGTISFLMDCDTTGVEPDFSLVKFKELVGGGQMTIVNRTVPLALATLGYTEPQIEQIEAHLAEHGTIVGAPGLSDEHLPVFDVAVGERAISHMGHIRMMGAVQPFISGAISKTVNLPQEATVEDIADAYVQAWRQGVKALAIYRDGSKTAQALRTDAQEQAKAPADVEQLVEAAVTKALAEVGPRRRRMPVERQSITHKFSIGGHEGYITAGMYADGSVGEIFLTDIGKEGSTLRGMMNSFATAISIALQYGVPLETLVQKFSYMRFEPEGITGNTEIPFAKSMPDYIMRWLASRFLDVDAQEELGILTPEVRARKAAQDALVASSDTAGPPAADADPSDTPTASAGGASSAPTRALTDSPPVVPAKLQGLDLGPACSQCGGMMQRTGSCYTCSSCGNNTGCG